MPIPAPLIAAGASILSSGISRLFGARSNKAVQNRLDNYKRPVFNNQIDQRYSSLLDNFNNQTNQQFGRFREIASAGTPGLSALIGSDIAGGGTGALANLRQRAVENNNLSGAFDAFRDYQIGREGQRIGLLNNFSQRDATRAGADLQARQLAQNEISVLNNAQQANPFVGLFGALSGQALGLAGETARHDLTQRGYLPTPNTNGNALVSLFSSLLGSNQASTGGNRIPTGGSRVPILPPNYNLETEFNPQLRGI